ncbi:MAG: hypothetical protein K2Y37_04095 [Pirellulales bacterium]|nr:hypothetical protein [Pirellulales bacterium]
MVEKHEEVLRIAQNLMAQDPDWVTFFREVLGVEGAVRRIFNTPEEFASFEKSREYSQLQSMLARVRERSRNKPVANEPTRVITVRLPKSLHDALRTEAHERRTSMNRLCITKLLQVIDGELVAVEA